MPGLFEQIAIQARDRELSFLVIGGLAVNFYGFSRDTADLDLLINRAAREEWLTCLIRMGYSNYAARDAFIQLSPPKDGEWPVDLMIVDDATFVQMYAHAMAVEMYGVRVLVPALEHLIALKLHALKHTHAGRFLKGFLDVENLVRINKLDLRSETVRKLFLKYGNQETYEKYPGPASPDHFEINESAVASDLNLPVAPDCASLPPRLDFQVMLRRIAQTMPWRSTRPGTEKRRLAEKIREPFVL